MPIAGDIVNAEIAAENVLRADIAQSLHVGQAALLHMKSVAQLRDDLLARVYGQSYTFFEKLVIDLLLAMGYAGASEKACATSDKVMMEALTQ